MITYILLFLWIALVVFSVVVVLRYYMLYRTAYQFQDWEKSDLPYITVDVQGKKLNMIADSAGAVSLIRREVLETLSVKPSTRKVNLCSITNEGVDSEVVVIPISINGKEMDTDFVVYDGDDIGDFKRHGITIHGLLGVEFFKKTKGKVDFKTQSVVFS